MEADSCWQQWEVKATLLAGPERDQAGLAVSSGSLMPFSQHSQQAAGNAESRQTWEQSK